MNKISYAAGIAIGIAVAALVHFSEARDPDAALWGYAFAAALAGGLSLAAYAFTRRRGVPAVDAAALEAQVAERTQHLQASLAQLRAAKQAAEMADGAKSQFLARMSREIRTPMNGVLGMTEMLRLSSLNPRQRQLVDIVHRSASSVVEVIDDILDFSKMQNQSLEIAALAFDPRAAIEDAVEMLAGDAHAKGIELVLALRSSLPSSVVGDGARLRQIVSNLVSNAIKFTERGEVVVRGSAKPHGAGGVQLELSVRDTGPGIRPERLPTLFAASAQSGAPRRAASSGLGLTIVRQLVELMGGRISVDSQPGRGTTFSFTLLLAADPQARPAPSLARLSGLRVLIVDDNRMARETLADQLREYGVEAEVAGGAKRGLEILMEADKGRPIAVVIVDGHMAGSSAEALAAEAKADPRHAALRVLELVAFDPRSAVAAQSPAPGIEALITKPVRTARIIEALGASVARAGYESRAPSATSDVVAPASAPAPAPEGGLGLAVMLVDDNPIDRQVAMAMLESAGCVVITAEDGQEALEVLTPDSVDLVLMDCLMPSMDGYAAVREIRQREAAHRSPRVPIVALTASIEEEDQRKCLDAGMDAVLGKPIARADLLTMLRRFAKPVRGAAQAAVHGANAVLVPFADGQPRAVLAEHTITGLKAMGGAELLPALVQSYQRESVGAIAAMRVAARTGDANALAQAFRFLDSTSAALGGERLAFVCRQAEESARRGELAGAVSLIDRVVAEHRDFARVLAGRLRAEREAGLGATA